MKSPMVTFAGKTLIARRVLRTQFHGARL